MSEDHIVAVIILVIGVLQLSRPELLLQFQKWTQKHIMGAKYEPTERTCVLVRVIGALLVVLGVLILMGVIE